MRWQMLHEREGARAFVLVFEPGDAVVDGVTRFADAQGLDGAHFTAIGAFRDLVLAYWNPESKAYEKSHIEEQVEVASLVGNVSLAPDGEKRKVHAHVVIGTRDHAAKAGHLVEAHVYPTLEVFVKEAPVTLQREHHEETGLALLRPPERLALD